MEWPDFQCSSPLSDPSWRDSMSPPLDDVKKLEWAEEDNKLFENALSEVDLESPGFFENVASRVPWKSIGEIKTHYQALVDDLEMIQSDGYPIPKDEIVGQQSKGKTQKESPTLTEKTCNGGQKRRRGIPWTHEEHQLFLMGLNRYGKGDWRSISRYYVVSKTPTQVASHAQKYFRRQISETPADRRRPSIHDIKTVHVNPTTFNSQIVPPIKTTINIVNIPKLEPNPNFPSADPVPVFHTNNVEELGNVSNVEDPMFPPIDTSFLADHDQMVNQASSSHSRKGGLPSLKYQHWG